MLNYIYNIPPTDSNITAFNNSKTAVNKLYYVNTTGTKLYTTPSTSGTVATPTVNGSTMSTLPQYNTVYCDYYGKNSSGVYFYHLTNLYGRICDQIGGYYVPASALSAITTGTYSVDVDSGNTLSLRSSQSTSASKLQSIPAGTKVTVFEISGEWGKVTYNGSTGWLHIGYLKYVPGSSATYTITWDVNGSTTTETYAYGATPSYKGSTPTKASTSQYTYTFTGWSPSISSVTGNKTYTAQFSSTTRNYTITWDVNGTKTTETYAYGATPSYKGSTPTKASDVQYSYTFSGWSPSITTVTGNKTYTAQFSSTARNYTITWDVNGSTTTETYAYGATPSYKGSTPTKASTAQYTYTFTGWSPSITTVTGNKTYTAQFSSTTRSYTITWDVNGTKTTETYAYGATPSYKGSTPTKASTAQYTYTFTGWSPSISSVTGNKTYMAQFTATPIQGDFRVEARASKTSLNPGDTFTVDYAICSVPSTGLCGWQFHADYNTNVFEITSCSIPFYIEGECVTGVGNLSGLLCGTLSLANFYSDAVVGTVTFKVKSGAASGQYSIGFNVNTAGDVFYCWVTQAVNYNTPSNQACTVTVGTSTPYTITWNVNGTTTTETYAYGATPSYKGSTPTKASTSQYSYTFSGWSPSITTVTGNKTYTAIFDAIAKPTTGDVNGDGLLSIGDVTVLLQLLADGTVSTEANPAADLNGDGLLSIGDVSCELTLLAGAN